MDYSSNSNNSYDFEGTDISTTEGSLNNEFDNIVYLNSTKSTEGIEIIDSLPELTYSPSETIKVKIYSLKK